MPMVANQTHANFILTDANAIANRLADIKKTIERARRLKSSGAESGEAPTLIAVTKTQPINNINIAFQLGLRHFGENRIQECEQKFFFDEVGKKIRSAVTLHFLGQLQSNKAKKAIELFDVIHSLDRESLAKVLAQQYNIHRDQRGTKPFPKLLVEVNVGEEPQKGGIAKTELLPFLRYLTHDLQLPIGGLMAMLPTKQKVGGHLAPYFAYMQQARLDWCLEQQLPRQEFLLSMGMSDDYPEAIEFDADLIRLGRALFGERP